MQSSYFRESCLNCAAANELLSGSRKFPGWPRRANRQVVFPIRRLPFIPLWLFLTAGPQLRPRSALRICRNKHQHGEARAGSPFLLKSWHPSLRLGIRNWGNSEIRLCPCRVDRQSLRTRRHRNTGREAFPSPSACILPLRVPIGLAAPNARDTTGPYLGHSQTARQDPWSG